jgi:signal transduction histidine kinase
MSSTLRSPRLKLKITEIDFKKIVSEAVIQLRSLDGAHKVEVKTTIEGCLPFFSDAEQVEILFSALISNAIKYRHSHELHPALNIHIEVEDKRAKMVFSDNGVGIDRAYLSKVFDMFFRIPGTRADGAGLGLFIVKEIVKKMKGKVKAESDTGTGTIIIMELPNLIDPDHLRKLNKLIQNSQL